MDRHYAIVTPCFNEGDVSIRFLHELESVLAECAGRFTIVVVDDASSDNTLDLVRAYAPKAGNVSLRPIALAYNMGHQEAIYQGLQFASTTDAEHFIVIDGDGEDDPTAIRELCHMHETPIVFIARGRRSESLGFRVGYWIYKRIFRTISGRSINFGNYSMIDRKVLSAVLDKSFVHYAAFLSRMRVSNKCITRDRRSRIDGRSKMSYRSLSVHAFRALIEYSEELVSIFLRAFVYMAAFFLVMFLGIIGLKVLTPYAIPGWASLLSVSLFNSMIICLGFFAIGLLLVNTAQRRERAGRHLYTVITAEQWQP